jgi:hypothetical protein
MISTEERSMKVANEVAKWLRSLPDMAKVKACVVEIDGQVFEGAYYEATMRYTSNMKIVLDGKVKAGDPYTRRSVYLVGDLPNVYRKRRKTCFVIPGEDHEWYISSYSDKRAISDDRTSEFHPFGLSFQLAPWEHLSKIDDFARHAYTRVPVTVGLH